ncbi:HAD family phosphatase [Glutamicibacter sp.]|uniref:HAD family hydrolase n=1 Tax=Glutamicibacter sp. TaxID=1931995 RepID=UPI0028BD9AE4|nr:HAD family phosphatase [Glutamicibacter sp.]
MIHAVVFDLDGVLRNIDSAQLSDLELRCTLPAGAISAAAFQPSLLIPVTTGQITRAQWIEQVGMALGNHDAAAQWGRIAAVPNRELLAMVDEIRSAGILTAILTNGTDRIAEELAEQGIGSHFDQVFNSAELGVIKPDPAIFAVVLKTLSLKAHEVFFTDDSANKLTGAAELGMRTHHYQGVEALRRALVEHGVLQAQENS